MGSCKFFFSWQHLTWGLSCTSKEVEWCQIWREKSNCQRLKIPLVNSLGGWNLCTQSNREQKVVQNAHCLWLYLLLCVCVCVCVRVCVYVMSKYAIVRSIGKNVMSGVFMFFVKEAKAYHLHICIGGAGGSGFCGGCSRRRQHTHEHCNCVLHP